MSPGEFFFFDYLSYLILTTYNLATTTAATTPVVTTATPTTAAATTAAATTAADLNRYIGVKRNLTHRAHASYGYIEFTSETEIKLTDLYYDGAGPKTNWIIGNSVSPGVTDGTYVIDKLEADGQPSYAADDFSDSVPTLPAYNGNSLDLKLPVINGVQLKGSDIKWVALYCRKVKMLFMDIIIPDGFN